MATNNAQRQSSKDQLRIRRTSDRRVEHRYVPKTSVMFALTQGAMAVASALAGAGIYGQWLRADELGPHKAAMWLILTGGSIFLGAGIFGRRPAKALRVGDAGVAEEKDASELVRIPWCRMKQVSLREGTRA